MQTQNYQTPALMFGGIPVYINDLIGLHTRILRQRRPHKKRRIAKKWRKRFGVVVEEYHKPEAYTMPGRIVCNSLYFEKLKNALQSR
jgi:hypothetical protein